MNKISSTREDKPEELILAEKLINDAKVYEAHEQLDNFEKKKGLNLRDKISCRLLRGDLLFQQGRYKEALKLAEETYDLSLGLGNNLQSIDCLIIMAKSFNWLGMSDKLPEVINQGEELLKNLTQVVSSKKIMKRKASISFIKGFYYGAISEIDLALKYRKQSLEIGKKIDFKEIIAVSLRVLAYMTMIYSGDMDLAFEYVKRGVAIAKENKNKFIIAQCLLNLAIIHSFSGEWERSINIYNECLSIYEELDNKERMSTVLCNIAELYRDFSGDMGSAAESIEKSLKTYPPEDYVYGIGRLYEAITIAIKEGDLERAKSYFQRVEIIYNQEKGKSNKSDYLLSKALMLKASSRFSDLVQSSKILKKFIKEEIFSFEKTRLALVYLCDILLTEFQVSNNLDVLIELEPLIAQLLGIAEKTQAHWIQAEIYLFQAKLALISFDVKKSRRFLTQAQQIAEERFELAQISEQIERMNRAHLMVTTQITEDKVAIHQEKKICLVCRGEVLRFSYICVCGAIYCENCARAVSDLENVCWACEAPIDYTKPIKSFDQEEGKIKVREEAKKK
jgi:tetratricopeptide (TPR) repeat protein